MKRFLYSTLLGILISTTQSFAATSTVVLSGPELQPGNDSTYYGEPRWKYPTSCKVYTTQCGINIKASVTNAVSYEVLFQRVDVTAANIAVAIPNSMIGNLGTTTRFYPNLPRGEYSFKVRGIDSLGNTGPWSSRIGYITIVEDTESPKILSANISYSAMPTLGSSINFSFSFADDYGLLLSAMYYGSRIEAYAAGKRIGVRILKSTELTNYDEILASYYDANNILMLPGRPIYSLGKALTINGQINVISPEQYAAQYVRETGYIDYVFIAEDYSGKEVRHVIRVPVNTTTSTTTNKTNAKRK